MPLYLYTCRACDHEFETLVRAGSEPACPSCKSSDLERQIVHVRREVVRTHARHRRQEDQARRRAGWEKTAEIEKDAEKHRREDH